ncbi:putative acetyltransferase [Salmonella phage pSal-SNUABM-04]|nr:putative acetyltransferase [Salmonella phage pSal-SNUABM-04]
MLYIEVSPDKVSGDLFPGLRKWIDDQNEHRGQSIRVVMAVEDDIPMGVMAYANGQILYIYVPEESRRGGVGTALLKRAVLESKGSVVSAKVHPSNVDGLCFMLKCGFAIDGVVIGLDNVRYHRMTNNIVVVHTPPEEKHLETFVTNVPIFLSMAEGNF